MQTRSRTAATNVIAITKVLKSKKASNGRIQKSVKRSIVTTSSTATAEKPATLQNGASENGHPLEEKVSRDATPPAPNVEDPTLATLKSPTSHRLIHLPHSELHATFLQRASAHLISVDPRFKTLLDKNTCHIYTPKGLAEGVDPYKALVSGILSQQISGLAAKSIQRKFLLLFSEPDDEGNPPAGFFPTPAQVLTKPPEVLRTAGLSGRKVEYVLDLSQRFVDGRLNANDMIHDTDEQIIEKLVEVRGIGRWSAEMFLMFALKRPDILSTGDLGIQRGMAVWTGKSIANAKGKTGKFKYMAEEEMIKEGEKWRPYRSLGSWLMWKIEGDSAPAS